ncbi:MAG: J domain-containing protein [Phycisphaerales bacterium]|nr:DnaJ domain-containing protein [Phycisphaeraceae bacterium]
MLNTHYDTLGLTPSATSEEVRRAFRELAKKLHPDASGRSTEAAFSRVQAAYDVLSDPQRRELYDATLAFGGSATRSGSAAGQEPAGPGHVTWTNIAGRGQTVNRAAQQRASDFDAIYDEFFARRAAALGQGDPPRASRSGGEQEPPRRSAARG